MKRLCLFSLLLLFLCASVNTLAETAISGNVVNVPESVKTIVQNGRWSKWEITGWVNPDDVHSSSACAFAVVKNGEQNVLLAFAWKDNKWIYKWFNAAALPQILDPIFLCDDSMVNDGFCGPRFSSYSIMNNETMDNRCMWVQQSSGIWRLVHLYCYDPLMFFDTSVDGALHLYNTDWVSPPETDVWVYGVYQTNLRYFDIGEFPRTAKEARAKLSNPPQIPAGTLSAKKIQFSSGKKYKVYQGPGEEYGQAGKEKAVVSTNDWIQVFGIENDWMLIQYDITSDHMRIGWIPASALPKKASVDELNFSPVIATTTKETSLTDDPLNSQTSILTIPCGQQVEWLATMGEWAYIESGGNQPVRGFIHMDVLTSK